MQMHWALVTVTRFLCWDTQSVLSFFIECFTPKMCVLDTAFFSLIL